MLASLICYGSQHNSAVEEKLPPALDQGPFSDNDWKELANAPLSSLSAGPSSLSDDRV